MEKLVFATNNRHKLEEVSAMTGGTVKIVSLAEIGCHDDIPETADTFQGNALQKAAYVYEHFGLPCFADDSGLEVDCLEGIPGVLSARYAGEHGNSEANIAKLLDAMKGSENRKADFKTVVALILPDGKTEFFEGRVDGVITMEKRGEGGFGYDPIFIPDGYDKTFAELGENIKNKISHRAKAIAALCEYLKRLPK
ncbi:MAG TPA: non-canonical purine NTP diphosphatase [Candidatus Avibacteroides excrementipullorum]|nr:non-canonical purine NTP diphosphatase [Candidatus Avibacteroides excrementipullorum]